MISRELQVTLQLAMTEAVNRRHEYVCLEHLLYAMLHDVTTSNILRNCRRRPRRAAAQARALSRRAGRADAQGRDGRAALRDGRAARAAARRAPRAVGGPQEINGGNVLVAMFHETESPAFLLSAGARRHPLRRDQFHFARSFENLRRRGTATRAAQREEERGRRRARRADGDDEGERKVSPSKALTTYAINLTERAAQGSDRSAGRAQEGTRTLDSRAAAAAQK